MVLDDLLITLGKGRGRESKVMGKDFMMTRFPSYNVYKQEIQKAAFWRKGSKFNLDINIG